tara:strand:+ start:977 stop:1939 length:963 start_codon:yes stop_codon:yes gene_type:complete
MKILITGCAGFIGYHLTYHCLKESRMSIVGVDNLNDYYDIKLKYRRLENLNKNNNFIFYKIDISNYDDLENIFSDNDFDLIINLAAQAGVRYSLINPESYIGSNYVGFFNLLECAKKFNKKHIIYASSSSVYGDTNNIPFREDSACNPLSLYAASKIANENLASAYSHNHGMTLYGLRFFTVYGPYGRPDMAYFSFTRNLLANEKIKVFNNGDMARDMTYIDDVIYGINSCINEIVKETEPVNEIYNLGNNHPVKLWDLIELISSHFQKKFEIEHSQMQTEVKITYADIDKANRKFNFKPKVDIKDGMDSFFRWYNNFYN